MSARRPALATRLLGRVLVVGIAASSGCVGPDAGTSPFVVPSIEAFERDVQPDLLARCGSGACHGRVERPLALLVPGTSRLDPARTFLDEPLDLDETAENAARVFAFADRRPVRRSLIVCKPLRAAHQGCAHGGGRVFTDPSDPLCRSLEAWLEGPASSADSREPR